MQRTINPPHTAEIEHYYATELAANREPRSISTIQLVLYNDRDYDTGEPSLVIIDGQHRLAAAKSLLDKGVYNLMLYFEINWVDGYEELGRIFDLINKNTDHPKWPDRANKGPVEAAYDLLFNPNSGFGSSMLVMPNTSSTKSVCRPKLTQDAVERTILVIFEATNATPTLIFEMVIKHNNKLKALFTSEDAIRHGPAADVSRRMVQTCMKNHENFLGIHKAVNNIYPWHEDVTKLIRNDTSACAPIQKTKKKPITKSVKNAAIAKHNPKKSSVLLCACCRATEFGILGSGYHMGHIISENDGGEATVDNLVPICVTCNTSMGTRHMGEFIKEYHPKNYPHFLRMTNPLQPGKFVTEIEEEI